MPMGMIVPRFVVSDKADYHIGVGFLLFIDLEGSARTSFCE